MCLLDVPSITFDSCLEATNVYLYFESDVSPHIMLCSCHISASKVTPNDDISDDDMDDDDEGSDAT